MLDFPQKRFNFFSPTEKCTSLEATRAFVFILVVILFFSASSFSMDGQPGGGGSWKWLAGFVKCGFDPRGSNGMRIMYGVGKKKLFWGLFGPTPPHTGSLPTNRVPWSATSTTCCSTFGNLREVHPQHSFANHMRQPSTARCPCSRAQIWCSFRPHMLARPPPLNGHSQEFCPPPDICQIGRVGQCARGQHGPPCQIAPPGVAPRISAFWPVFLTSVCFSHP